MLLIGIALRDTSYTNRGSRSVQFVSKVAQGIILPLLAGRKALRRKEVMVPTRGIEPRTY
jgi:hypothetical protein